MADTQDEGLDVSGLKRPKQTLKEILMRGHGDLKWLTLSGKGKS